MVVTSNASSSTTIETRSLLPFLKKFSNIRLIKTCYILVDPILSPDWYCFKLAIGRVKSYHVVKGPENEPAVSASVFGQIVSELKGEPFFPNLTSIHVSDLENFLKHYYFLLSSRVESVSAVLSPAWFGKQGGIVAFIQALISFAPRIKFFSIIHAEIPLKISSIGGIDYLTTLRTLVISRLADVQKTADIFSFLKDLVELEELKLTIGDSVQTWSPAQRTHLSPAPDRTILPTGTSYLESLQSLDITGPSQIISEFLDFLGSPNLVSLSLASTCWLHFEQPPLLPNEPFDASEQQVRESDQPSNQQPAELRSRSCTAACVSSHHHEWILSRWSKTLESLTVSSCNQTSFDLSVISELEALRTLVVKGDPPATVPLSSGIPTCYPLQTLDLSFTYHNLELAELDEVLLRTPNLLRLSSPFWIGSESELDSLAEIKSPPHRLEEFRMYRAIPGNREKPTLRYTLKVAQRLHLLFPNLKQLHYPPGCESEVKFWEDVWDLVQSFKKVALDAKRRPATHAS